MTSRIARLALISLIAIIVLAIALVFMLDFGRFKGRIETAVSDALGRDFVIAGPLHATVGGSIEVRASDIRLAATDWSSEQQLIEVGSAEASIETWSLVSGPIKIERLVIEHVRANLEVNLAGEANWAFATSGDVAEQESAALDRLPAMADNVSISDVVVSYRSPDREFPRQFILEELTENLAADRLEVSAEGRVNDTPFEFSLDAGSVDELIALGGVDMQLDGQLGEVDLRVGAMVADLRHPGRPEVDIALRGPNVEYLFDVIGAQHFTTGPLRLDGGVMPDNGAMRVNVAGAFGEFELSADGRFVNLRPLDEGELRFSAAGPDAGRLAGLLGVDDVPNDSFSVSGHITRSGPSLIVDEMQVAVGDTSFDLSANLGRFPSASGAVARVEFSGPDLSRFNRLMGLPGRLGGPFRVEVSASPRDQGGAAVELRANTGDIAYTVDGELTESGDLVGSRLEIGFRGPDLRVVADALGIVGMPDGEFSGAASVERLADGIRLRDGRFTSGQDQVSFAGVVGDNVLSSRTSIEFDVFARDLENTLSGFGVNNEYISADEFRISGKATGDDTGILLESVEASYAGLDAALSARIALPDIIDDSVIEFRIAGNDLSRVIASSDAFRSPAESYELGGTARLAGGALSIPDLEFAIGESRLSADVQFAADLASARLSLDASSPDLNRFSPALSDSSTLSVVPFRMNAALDWRNNLVTIDEIRATVGQGKLGIHGVVQGPPDFDRTDLQVEIDIANLRNLSILAGRELPEQRGRLMARLKGEGNVVRLEEFAGSFGESDVRGDFELKGGDKPQIDLALQSNRLDLTAYLPPTATAESGSSTAASGTAPSPADERVIPDEPLSFEVLHSVDADIRLQIGEMIVRQHHYLDVGMEATIDDGYLRIENLHLRNAAGGELDGRIVIEPSENGSLVGARLFGRGLKLGLPATTAEEYDALPSYDLNLAFISSGRSSRELAAAVNGYMKLTSGEGMIRAGAMRMFTNDFLLELLNTVNPFVGKDPYSHLNCAAVLATVENGKVVGAPILVVQSDRLNIFANTQIDLATEKLDADFNTVPMKGLGISLSNLVNPYVKVSGTLARPTLGLDAESTLIEGGAAVATGGISILAKGLKDRFFSDKDPCGTAVADAEEQFKILEEKYGRGGGQAE